VTEIARASGVETSLLYRWRRQFAGEPQAPSFVAIRVAEDNETVLTAPACAPAPSGSIAISFGEQVRMTVEGSPDAATLTNVISALTAGGRFR
jgi:transposase